jgi:hypothetical protein
LNKKEKDLNRKIEFLKKNKKLSLEEAESHGYLTLIAENIKEWKELDLKNVSTFSNKNSDPKPHKMTVFIFLNK